MRWSGMIHDKVQLERIKHYALILLGCLIGALAYPLYLTPNHIAPGGVTGVSTVLHFTFDWPIGLSSLLLNVPLFIFGYRLMGRVFVFRTLIATLLFSLLIDLLRPAPMTHDPLLGSVFGGIILGIGLGLILRGGATTGGTDLLARVVHRHLSVISVGAFLFAFDFSVILLAGFTMSAELAMYSLISVFVATMVLDRVLAGLGTDKACYIITQDGAAITRRLLSELSRGVTVLDAVGAYSSKQVKMLLCVVGRVELMRLKEIVNDEDPHAFVFITDTHETLGEGFRNLIEKNP
ncbi:MAG: YitT family protein [Christensenellales bacterium]